MERWRRRWHLRGTGWFKNWALPWALALLIAVVFLSLRSALREAGSWVGSRIEESRLWMSLGPSRRYLIVGAGLVALGAWLVRSTAGSRRNLPSGGSTVLRVRVFVAGCAFLVAGGICVLKAFGLL